MLVPRDDVVDRIPQLFVFGFEGLEPTPFIRGFLERGGGGVILFRRNIDHAEALLALNRALRCASPSGTAMSWVDQEGGPVRRLGALGSEVPAMAALGAKDDLRLTRRIGRLLGREVRAVGFNVNAAPVLDVHTCATNPIIGARAFSSDPERCGAHGATLARGLHEEGVLACAKHFPGHGDTTADSHLELPRLPHDAARLRQVELPPFRHALRAAHISLLMTAHVLYEGVDAEHPATLSPPVLDGLLRRELGYDGVVVSDDLEMRALADRYTPEERVELGLRAGVDLFLSCRDEQTQRRALEHAERLARDGVLTAERLARSERRLARVRGFLRDVRVPDATEPARWLRCPEHAAWIAAVQ